MADIKIYRNHNLDESRLVPQLEKLAAEIRMKYGIRSEFHGNRALLSGSSVRKGVVTWDSEAITIELTLDMMGKILKSNIEKEIKIQMEVALAG